jgi:two-component system cell cycle sensor histidine kinase/response regulator CckA
MKSEQVFALDQAGWPALLLDSTSTICRANASAVRLFGSALEGGAPLLSTIWSPENASTAEQFLAHWERAPTPSMALRFRAKGGAAYACQAALCTFSKEGQKYFVLQLFPEIIVSGPNAYATSGETSFTHKSKLDCALQLARSVALDFNNALTSILGHTSLVLSQMEPENPWRNSLLEVEKSALKAAGIANDLGGFSQQEKELRTQAAGNVNMLVQRCVDPFRKQAGLEAVSWGIQLERNVFAAKFDEAKMQQVLVKILENSREALSGLGRITVQTRNLDLADPTQDRHVQLAPGQYVCVEITDSGCGIEPEVLPRIFEPFFTTKHGVHRGLGLAWVYGIVTNHGGGVAVSSQPGTGTSVRVYLPAEKRVVHEDAVGDDDLNGNQTVLMVDDEDALLTTGQTILSAYGYQVLTANSGQKALELLAHHPATIDLVITDLVMPAMSGRELVEHIHRLAPGMRVLCTSGYVWPAGQEMEAAYLQKPFTSRELLLKVKRVLAAA